MITTNNQKLTEETISSRLLRAPQNSGSFVHEIRKIGEEHHLACENAGPSDFRNPRLRECSALDTAGHVEKGTPLCSELTAFIACVCVRGVLLVQSSVKRTVAPKYFFFGQLQDIEFARQLQRGLTAAVAKQCRFKLPWLDNVSIAALEQGVITGILKTTLTTSESETIESSDVDSIVGWKERFASKKVKRFGFTRLSNNMTPQVAETAKTFFIEMGMQIGSAM